MSIDPAALALIVVVMGFRCAVDGEGTRLNELLLFLGPLNDEQLVDKYRPDRFAGCYSAWGGILCRLTLSPSPLFKSLKMRVEKTVSAPNTRNAR